MKHFTLVLLMVGAVALTGFAQSVQTNGQTLLEDVPQLTPALRTAAPMPTKAIADFSDRPQQPLEGQSDTDIEHIQNRELVVQRQVIGYTQYDLQSNAAIDDRMAGGADALSAAWTMSLGIDALQRPRNGLQLLRWHGVGRDRLRDVSKPCASGWPSIVHTASGREVIVSHPGIDTPLHMAWRDAGDRCMERSLGTQRP